MLLRCHFWVLSLSLLTPNQSAVPLPGEGVSEGTRLSPPLARASEALPLGMPAAGLQTLQGPRWAVADQGEKRVPALATPAQSANSKLPPAPETAGLGETGECFTHALTPSLRLDRGQSSARWSVATSSSWAGIQ